VMGLLGEFPREEEGCFLNCGPSCGSARCNCEALQSLQVLWTTVQGAWLVCMLPKIILGIHLKVS
jgi:hypothetical protein